MTRYKIFWAVLIALGVLWAMLPTSRDESTNVRLFCAYGKVFVEFHEKSNIWGVIMLDNSGRPIRCRDDNDAGERAHESTNFRGTI